jgi:hypothetical protein
LLREEILVQPDVARNYLDDDSSDDEGIDADIDDDVTLHTKNKLKSLTPKRHSLQNMHSIAHHVPGIAVGPRDNMLYIRKLKGDDTIKMKPTGHHIDELQDLIVDPYFIKHPRLFKHLNRAKNNNINTVFEMPLLNSTILRYKLLE